MSLEQRWKQALQELRQQGRLRELSPPRGWDFTSNDYLGYGAGRRPLRLEVDLDRWPATGMASRLLRGHQPVWEEVEARLAAWHGAEAALLMTSGFVANEGLIATVVEPGDWVAADELCHASIHEALRICRPRKFLFRHNDLDHLEEGLKREAATRPAGRAMVVITESLFSMDGDWSPLPQIVELAERYGAYVIVDEAHSTGCCGPRGAGYVDALGLRPRLLATVHTGGKALGLCGAYICGSRLLKEYLVNRCRHLIFTTALPPLLGPLWLAGIERVQQDAEGREWLAANVRHFREELARRPLGGAGSALASSQGASSMAPVIGGADALSYIMPVIVGADAAAVAVAQRLQQRGYDVRAIRPPSVPPGTARLRISIHADHSPELLSGLAEALQETFQAIGPQVPTLT